MLSEDYILWYKNGRNLYRCHGDSCVGIGEVTTGRSERRRNHKVDAIFQCKEPEGVKRDGKAGRVFWRSVWRTGQTQCGREETSGVWDEIEV